MTQMYDGILKFGIGKKAILDWQLGNWEISLDSSYL
jgi:hypothetical protein